MGAATTMLEAGAVARFGRYGSDRFDAYAALSPQGVGIFWTETSWRAVRKPVLMVTGTRDSGPDGDYTTRLEAFRRLPAGPSHRLAIFEGANHFQLSGRSSTLGDQLAELIDDFVAGRPSQLPGVTVSSR
jgi:pimeloyl-ACP methyl ester carboxylesterase